MSQTPRTDKELAKWVFYEGERALVYAEDFLPFVRQLEIENDELTQRLHALRLVCGTTDANKFETSFDRANVRAAKAEAENAELRKALERIKLYSPLYKDDRWASMIAEHVLSNTVGNKNEAQP